METEKNKRLLLQHWFRSHWCDSIWSDSFRLSLFRSLSYSESDFFVSATPKPTISVAQCRSIFPVMRWLLSECWLIVIRCEPFNLYMAAFSTDELSSAIKIVAWKLAITAFQLRYIHWFCSLSCSRAIAALLLFTNRLWWCSAICDYFCHDLI